MNLSFQSDRGDPYKSGPQRIKNLSEHWFSQQVYCPSCGQNCISQYPNNRPVADFFCSSCAEDYELKSQAKVFGRKVADGAYRTMMERLRGSRNPNLFLLHYDPLGLTVRNLIIIPKHFFIPSMIEERKPLSASAQRAGWIGCNISLSGVPDAGRIFLIRNRLIVPIEDVRAKWQRTLFLQQQKDTNTKGWLLSIIKCIEKLGKPIFNLEEIYKFEEELKREYASNRHVRAKMRQKLQILRDMNYMQFMGKGTY